jgi:molybdopterin synthase sulfur carrier subunit
MLDLLYFGALRDSIGRDGERVDPPSHVLTLADLIAWLALRGEPYASAFAEPGPIHGAVEGEAVGAEGSVFGAREVALFPLPGAL